MKEKLKLAILALLAGVFIGLGGYIYLSINLLDINGWQKIIGSFLFASGLFAVCTFDLALFTGKIGRIVDNKPKYLLDLLIIFLGNTVGVILLAFFTRFTNNALVELAKNIMVVKYDKNIFSIFLLSIGCGFCMEFAVMGYRKLKPSIASYISIFLGVMLFILSGFEHVIANIYYLFTSLQFNNETIIIFLLMLIGNSIGAILLAWPIKVFTKAEETPNI